jgi:hypothetical protein
LRGGRFVEVSEDVEAQRDHGQREEDETGLDAEFRPGAGEVGLEEGELGDDEEGGNGASYDMGSAVKEEELFPISFGFGCRDR